jgi:glycosyltransferase involved in cell wall biosynthesis
MRILYIAYPLLPISEESAGGAEQMLGVLEREMAHRGHRTAVAACAGSRVAGEVVSTGSAPVETDKFDERNSAHTSRILEFLTRRQFNKNPFDLVHDMSGTFWPYSGALDLPVLATLHLPRSFYPPQMFQRVPTNLYFNCVSRAQSRSFGDFPRMMEVVPNGIEFENFIPLEVRETFDWRESHANMKEDYVLWLGRICEEKGAHLAIQAARRAGMRLVLAGTIYPFSYHQQYFQREILPHLDIPQPDTQYSGISFVESPKQKQKLRLLHNARAVLIPSLAEETSSLVAMEAAACGTPVVAFRRGGIPEVVVEGVTGFLVNSIEEMAATLGRIDEIDGAACRRHAQANYSSVAMADRYEQLYQHLISATSDRAA